MHQETHSLWCSLRSWCRCRRVHWQPATVTNWHRWSTDVNANHVYAEVFKVESGFSWAVVVVKTDKIQTSTNVDAFADSWTSGSDAPFPDTGRYSDNRYSTVAIFRCRLSVGASVLLGHQFLRRPRCWIAPKFERSFLNAAQLIPPLFLSHCVYPMHPIASCLRISHYFH
jgi:hypothetical protein